VCVCVYTCIYIYKFIDLSINRVNPRWSRHWCGGSRKWNPAMQTQSNSVVLLARTEVGIPAAFVCGEGAYMYICIYLCISIYIDISI